MNSIDEFGLTLGDHFITQTPKATGARIEIDEYFWDRIEIDGAPHEQSFVRAGTETRTTVVTVEGRGADRRAWVVSGLKDLVVAKTTRSEFRGFLKDKHTTLQETTARIMATSLVARWRYENTDVDFDKAYAQVRALLLKQFAQVHSYALQQMLYAMGQAVLEELPDFAEIRFKAPNKHHFLVDLSPFGVENPGEVFYAADRQYGLIEAEVGRNDATEPGSAWNTIPGFC